MAYTKKGYKRRRTGRRPNNKKIVSIVKRELRKKTELKNNVVISGVSGIAITDEARAINPTDYIRTGINSDDRIGDSINLTGHGLRSQVDGADSPYNRVRLCFVQTRNPLPLGLLGVDYEASSCFDPVYASMGLNAPLDRLVVSRVFYDKVFNLQRNVDGIGLTGRDVVRTFNKFVKNHQKVMYGSSATALATTLTNIYFVYQSDSSLLPHPTLTYVLKTWYTDS